MEALKKLVSGASLSASEAEAAMGEIMDGNSTPARIAALVIALRMKGETADEVYGFARAMRGRSLHVKASSAPVADTCGTGGDGKRTLNVSTGAALVAAAAGITVAKHGNRSVTSRAGSADVLEALGVKVDAPPDAAQRCLDGAGIAFLFAPVFHPAMRHAGPTRRELGVPTVFNMLGPLTNPAGADVQLLGVAKPEYLGLIGGALARLGTTRSLVVHSADGLDELTTTAANLAVEVRGHKMRKLPPMRAKDAGLRRGGLGDLAGGTPQENAGALMRMLKGERGAYRDAVAYNAGAVIWLAGRAKNLREGVAQAGRLVDSGSALAKLERLKELSNAPAPA